MKFSKWFMQKWRQIVFSLIVVGAMVMTGTVVGWSVEVSRMIEDPLRSFNITTFDQELLVSSSGVAAIFTSLLSGWLVELIGPCRLMQCLLLPAAVFWIVMATSKSFGWILAGRIITGGIGYMLTTIVQPLIAEVTQADIRGMLSTWPEFAISLGIMFVYIFAKFLAWEVSTLICGVIMFPVMAAFMFVPESPYWYIRKGNFSDARRSLKKLRSPDHDIDAEVTSIKEAIFNSKHKEGSFYEQIIALKEPANYRPTILLSCIFLFREMGGALVIFMYSAFFFQNAGVPLDPFTSTILIGATRLFFTLFSSFIIDYVGRRSILIHTSFVCSFSMFITGAVLKYSNPSVTWIPLLAVLVFTASFAVGSGPVPWVLLGEMLPTPVRSLASSICVCVMSIVLFLVVQFFPELLLKVGLDDVVLGFGSFHLVTGVIVWMYMPETKGRTLEELQTAFAGAALRPFRKSREGYLQTYGSTYPEQARVK